MLARVFKNKVIEYIVYAVLIIAVVTLGTYIFWTVEDPRVLDVKNAKTSETVEDNTVYSGIPIRPAQITPGGVIFIRLDYCKLHDVSGEVTAKLVGEKFTQQLTWPNDQTKTGCVDQEIPIPLPVDANDDTYYVEFEVLYHVNPLKDRSVVLRSDTFKVSK